MNRILLSVVLAALFCVTPALAVGVNKGEGEIGFDLGYTNFDSDVSSEDGGRFAVRGGYHFTDLFEIEGMQGGMAADDNGVDVMLSTFFVNGVFNLRPAKKTIVPYVLAGVGVARLQFDFGGGFKPDDTGTALQVAGGSRFFFGKKDRTAVRVEISMIREKTFDETSTHTNLTGGFTWTLGGS